MPPLTCLCRREFDSTLRVRMCAPSGNSAEIDLRNSPSGSGEPVRGVQQRLVRVRRLSRVVSMATEGELGNSMGECPRRGRGASAAIVVAATIVAVSACTGSSTPSPSTSPPPPSPASSSATPTTPTPDQTTTATSAVLMAYRGYWATRVSAQAHPEGEAVAELSRYSVDQALAGVRSTVLLFRQQGIVMKGEPVLSPSVTSIDLAGTGAAWISDCVDSSNWKPVYKATGKSALAPNQPPRVVMDSTAMIYAGHWVIRTAVAHRDRTC
jgi:hypothetical protein